MAENKPEYQEDKEYYFDSYKEFAWRFRLWLVAYGAGLPAVILSNKDLLIRVSNSDSGYLAILFSLIGVGVQILITWIFKTCMWYCDRHAKGFLDAKSRRYVAAIWISDRYYLEVILDLLTLVLYGASTCLLLRVILNP